MFQGLLCLIIVHFQGKSINSQHKGKNDNRQCKLCGEECESVVHVLWQCPVYDTIRNLLRGGGGGALKTLVRSIILRKQALFLGCEIWDLSFRRIHYGWTRQHDS